MGEDGRGRMEGEGWKGGWKGEDGRGKMEGGGWKEDGRERMDGEDGRGRMNGEVGTRGEGGEDGRSDGLQDQQGQCTHMAVYDHMSRQLHDSCILWSLM